MSHAVKNALETGRNVVESGASTLSELVDEARSRLEDLPPLAHARQKRRRKNSSTVLIVVLIVVLATVIIKKRRHQPADQSK